MIPQRIIDKLEVGDCWEWRGARTTAGYGHAWFNGKLEYLHRITYEALVGQIPDGFEIDHLCRNRACCNPDHLEPVTRSTNLQRGVDTRQRYVGRERVCKRGHVGMYSQWADGRHRCLACERASRRWAR